MVRKTNNSSQSLSGAVAQSLAINNAVDDGQCKASNRKTRKIPPTRRPTQRKTIYESYSSSSEADVDDQTDEDEGVAADIEEDEEGKPAAFAPSVRITIESDGQAGLLSGVVQESTDISANEKTLKRTTADRSNRQSIKQSNKADMSDDDYAAVDNISDSSGSESGAEKLAEQDILQEEMKLRSFEPSTGPWDDLPDGVLGEEESYFDHLSAPEHTGLSDVAGDDTDHPVWEGISDSPVEVTGPMSERALVPLRVVVPSLGGYTNHPDWEGIPDTPVEATGPMSKRTPAQSEALVRSLASAPSLRRVHFDLQNCSHERSLRKSKGLSEESRGQEKQDESGVDDADDGGSSSGYETDYGETTEEDDPPRSGREVYKAPHLLHRSSPSSLDPSPTSYVNTPQRSEIPFKLPSTPASHRRKGPRLGTFKTSPSVAYTMVDSTGDGLIICPATRPSPLSTPGHSRAGSRASYSAPGTPLTSQPTLATAPDLGGREFPDAAASQISTDPALSKGPDFITSAGFTHVPSRAPQLLPEFLQSLFSSIPPAYGDSSVAADPGSLSTAAQIGADVEAQDDLDESAFEDIIAQMIVMPDDNSSEDQAEIIVMPDNGFSEDEAEELSAYFETDASPDASLTVMKTHVEPTQASPTSESSAPNIDLFDHINAAAWPKNIGQRRRSQPPPNHSSHGLSLSGPSSSSKKRKLSESHDIQPPSTPTSKRRLLTAL